MRPDEVHNPPHNILVYTSKVARRPAPYAMPQVLRLEVSMPFASPDQCATLTRRRFLMVTASVAGMTTLIAACGPAAPTTSTPPTAAPKPTAAAAPTTVAAAPTTAPAEARPHPTTPPAPAAAPAAHGGTATGAVAQ